LYSSLNKKEQKRTGRVVNLRVLQLVLTVVHIDSPVHQTTGGRIFFITNSRKFLAFLGHNFSIGLIQSYAQNIPRLRP
jgi:hypothetical protein